jgi:hypothetical protein
MIVTKLGTHPSISELAIPENRCLQASRHTSYAQSIRYGGNPHWQI